MSLISLRNLSAPLRSKVQLGALLIAALLVLAIRLGASGKAGAPGSAPDYGSEDAEEEAIRRSQLTELLQKPTGDARSGSTSKRGSRSNDDVLDSLVDGRFDKELRDQQEQERKNESFEDIRKSLGLE